LLPSRALVKRIFRPSGDQPAGLSHAPFRVRRRCPLPSVFITHTSPLPVRWL
jgi:hypothetical protein